MASAWRSSSVMQASASRSGYSMRAISSAARSSSILEGLRPSRSSSDCTSGSFTRARRIASRLVGVVIQVGIGVSCRGGGPYLDRMSDLVFAALGYIDDHAKPGLQVRFQRFLIAFADFGLVVQLHVDVPFGCLHRLFFL